jgi:hypothetical protein
VDLVIDETLERRWGSKIRKRGHYRDRALSSKERRVEPPWGALDREGRSSEPALDHAEMGIAVLVRARDDSPRVSERLGKRHKTIAMWAHQMIRLVHRWLPEREIKLLGDTAYRVLELGLHAKTRAADADHHWPLGCRAP